MKKITLTPLKSIDKIVFNVWYQSGLLASVDWIGGGNFEGGIYRKYLKFSEKDNLVTMKIISIISRGESAASEKIVYGKFGPSYKGSIRLSFDGFAMNGFVLGESNHYIAFDLNYDGMKRWFTEAYERIEDKEK